jgi:hypothetical protein
VSFIGMAEILWHRREIRRQTEKTDISLKPEGLRFLRENLTAMQKSAEGIVCAGQRIDQVGLSPTGARMRGAISESGGNSSLAGEIAGGQGVHREVESEGHEEKYRAAIEEKHDEPVGQRWGKVEPALWRRRRSHSPIEPRCVRMAR